MRRCSPYAWKKTEATCGVILAFVGLWLMGYGLAWLLGWV